MVRRFVLAAAWLGVALLYGTAEAQRLSDVPGCAGKACGEIEREAARQGNDTAQLSLTVTDKVGNVPIAGRPIQRGPITVSVKTRNLPLLNPATLFKFTVTATSPPTEEFPQGNILVYTSDGTTQTYWTWSPNAALIRYTVEFSVLLTSNQPENLGKTSFKKAKIGPFLILDDERAMEIFSGAIGPVLTHPRCINCHARGESPTQGDDSHLHVPPVTRQTECTTCHREKNGTTPGSPPGISTLDWMMPPSRFTFAGKTAEELCVQITNPAQNGGRTLEELLVHVRSSHRVGWAWFPGPGRTPAPAGDQTMWAYSFEHWIKAGGACPGPQKPAAQVQSCCRNVANTTLNGLLGRLVVAFPGGKVAEGTRVAVLKDGKEILKGYGNKTWDLLPGTYEVTISGQRLPDVTVKARHDTMVKVGVLHVQVPEGMRVDILDPATGQPVAKGYGDKYYGLPAGSLTVKMGEQTETVTIEADQVTEF